MDKYKEISQYYENAFAEHGDTPQGLAWQDAESMEKRFEVMAGLMRESDYGVSSSLRGGWRILDLGCGTGKFLPYLKREAIANCQYNGMDMNPSVINFCKDEYPNFKENFSIRDIIKQPLELESYDYIVINGILTVKDKLSFDEMWSFAQDIIKAAYDGAAKGIAFNVMSKQVDWERDDLFHLPLDTLADFLTKNLSRNFIIRNDYGLYEYTVYVYRN